MLHAVAALADTADARPVADKLTVVESCVAPLRTAVGALAPDLAVTGALLRSEREAFAATADRLLDQLGSSAAETAALLQALRLVSAGGSLPETVRARLDWSTELLPWPSSQVIFAPHGGVGRLTLAVDVQAPTTPGGGRALW